MQTRTVPPRFPATPGRKDGVRAALFARTLECAPAWSGAVRRAGKQVAGVASVWCCHLPALGTLCPPPQPFQSDPKSSPCTSEGRSRFWRCLPGLDAPCWNPAWQYQRANVGSTSRDHSEGTGLARFMRVHPAVAPGLLCRLSQNKIRGLSPPNTACSSPCYSAAS